MNKDQADAIKPTIAAVTSELLHIITAHPDRPIYQHQGSAILRHNKRVRVVLTVYVLDDSEPEDEG